MKEQSRTNQDLLLEISLLQRRIKELELSEKEHLRALEALQRSETKFRTLYDSTSDAVLLMDQNSFFDCNDAALKTFGCSTREELCGMHPADLSPFVQPCRTESRVLGDHYIQIALKNGTHRFEWVHRRADTGETFPCDVLLSPMVIDGKTVLQAVVRDITQRKRMEEALLKEMEFNSTLVESSPAFFVAINADRTVRYINDAMLRALKYTPEELKNKDYMALVPESDREMLSGVFSTLITRGQPTLNENRVLTKDGKEILVEWHGRAIKKPDGSLDYFFGVGTDITDRKRAEEALRESEERFHQLFNHMQSGVAVYEAVANGADFVLKDLNRGAELIEGVERKTIIGKRASEAFPGVRDFGLFEVFQRVWRTGETEFFPARLYRDERDHGTWRENWVYKLPNGDVVAVYTDITENKKAVEALKESEEKFRLLFEQSVDPILLIHGNTFIDCNEAAVQFLQLSGREELIGLKPADISPERQPDGRLSSEKAREVIEQASRDGTNRFEWVHRTAGGEDFWVEVSLTVIPIQGKQMLFTVWRNITQRKKAEQALLKAHEDLEFRVQERTAELLGANENLRKEMDERTRLEDQLRQVHKMEAIGTLAGGIAHDFNNILAAVIGFAEMVEDDLPRDGKSTLRIQRVLKAAYRGRDLVKQILAFSRKTDVMRSPLSLSPLLEETVHLLRASLPSTIEIILSMEAASDTVLASPTEVQQIIVNLATNASFAMAEKGGTLGISVTNVDFRPDSPVLSEDVKPGEYVQLAVTDTGHGMEPHVMKRVFEPFFTTKGVGEGTGMGLAVVYGIVKGLNGSVLVESKPGMGSTFRVSLPITRTDEKSKTGKRQAVPRGSEHILFVDDEELLMEWAKDTLERLGYTVTACNDSTEALTLFSSGPYRFDLVIADQTMPKLTGISLAGKILALRPNIPVILCTGHSDSVSPEKAKKAGVKEFLMKPLGRQELASAVRMVLDAGEEQ